MVSMQCAACGNAVSVDEARGSGQPCPSCGQPVGELPVDERPQSTALDDLQEGGKPVRFGAYSKAAEAQWDDPMEPHIDDQVASLVKDEAIIDNAVINDVPPEVAERYKARQKAARKKLVGIGLVAALIVVALVAFILY